MGISVSISLLVGLIQIFPDDMTCLADNGIMLVKKDSPVFEHVGNSVFES
jgi:hypothetical protein